MSRTDAHAPFAVRMLRGEVAHYAVHLCADDPALCSLPDLEAGWTTGPDRCRWEWTFTGRNWCPCRMCHWPKRRQPRRSGRGARRTQLRGLAREWNGGDEGWGNRDDIERGGAPEPSARSCRSESETRGEGPQAPPHTPV